MLWEAEQVNNDMHWHAPTKYNKHPTAPSSTQQHPYGIQQDRTASNNSSSSSSSTEEYPAIQQQHSAAVTSVCWPSCCYLVDAIVWSCHLFRISSPSACCRLLLQLGHIAPTHLQTYLPQTHLEGVGWCWTSVG